MPYIVNVIFNILTSGLPCCLLAIGIFITFRLLDFADLTAEGSFLIGGSLAIALIRIGLNAYVATLIATIGGALCGYLTSVFYTKLKIPKILCGIITMTATTALALLILGLTSKDVSFLNNVKLRDEDETIYSLFYYGDPKLRPFSALLAITPAMYSIISSSDDSLASTSSETIHMLGCV